MAKLRIAGNPLRRSSVDDLLYSLHRLRLSLDPEEEPLNGHAEDERSDPACRAKVNGAEHYWNRLPS